MTQQEEAEDISRPIEEDVFPICFIDNDEEQSGPSELPTNPSQLGVPFPVWNPPISPPPVMHPSIGAQGGPAPRTTPQAPQPVYINAAPTMGPSASSQPPMPAFPSQPSPHTWRGQRVAIPIPDACSVCGKLDPIEDLINCSACGDRVHGSCLDPPQILIDVPAGSAAIVTGTLSLIKLRRQTQPNWTSAKIFILSTS